MVKIFAACAVVSFLLTAGCSSQKATPEELREKTAQATLDIKQDAKALAQGVKEGWNRDQTTDLNRASKGDLLTVPGINSPEAERIVAGRPYGSAHDLVSRHVISEQQYARIKNHVTVGP